MTNVEPWKAVAFVVSLLVLAGIVNSVVQPHSPPQVIPVRQLNPVQPSLSYTTASRPPSPPQSRIQPTHDAGAEKAKNAAREAQEAHAQFLSRYTDTTASRMAGSRMAALVAANENGKLDQTVAQALGRKLKTGSVELLPSFFKPEFISDGLFDKAMNGSTEMFRNLELDRTLDTLVLAKRTVAYSTNPSLENVITATMVLQVVITPVNGNSAGESVTFRAIGAGFNQSAARALAEERLLKQIERDTKLSLAQ